MSLNVIPFPGRIPQWTFAERARKVRRDLGYTQQQMADALDVGLKRYSAWESGKNSPDDIATIAVRFEKVSGTPRAWFLGWMNEDTPRPPDGVREPKLRLHPVEQSAPRPIRVLTPKAA